MFCQSMEEFALKCRFIDDEDKVLSVYFFDLEIKFFEGLFVFVSKEDGHSLKLINGLDVRFSNVP